MDGNPDLCVTGPCKKEKKKKNLAVPIIAAIVSSVVVLIVLAILWSYRRKQRMHGPKQCKQHQVDFIIFLWKCSQISEN